MIKKTIENEVAKQGVKYIWGLSEGDFLVLMQENHPDLNEEDKRWIIDEVKNSFSIYGWSDYVLDFIDLCIGDVTNGMKEMHSSYDETVRNDEYIWGIAVEDFEIYLLAKTPVLSKVEMDYVIEKAKLNFSIDDWSDYVREFISNRMESLRSKNK